MRLKKTATHRNERDSGVAATCMAKDRHVHSAPWMALFLLVIEPGFSSFFTLLAFIKFIQATSPQMRWDVH